MTSRIDITEECIDYSGESVAGTGCRGNERVSIVVGSSGEDGLEGEIFASGAGC